MRKNPFTPSFGKSPLVLAGRRSILDMMEQAFMNGLGDPNLASIIVGARGTGKTALLSAIATIAHGQGWVSVSSSALPGMLDDLLQQTYRSAGHLLAPPDKRRLTGVEIAQLVGIQWEPLQESSANWRTKMSDLLDQLESRGTGLLITLDEVDPALDEVKTLVSVYQHFVREERQVALVLAGLPHKVSQLLSDDDISFLRRARKHHLQRIPAVEARAAFEQTAVLGGKQVEPIALDTAVDAIQGFAYMLQLVGYWVWSSSGESDVITEQAAQNGVALAREDMKESVLESTYRTLSTVDRRFLSAMLQDARASRLADIADRMGVRSNYASRYKKRLLEQGIIGEYEHNVLCFEIPASREFLEERLRADGQGGPTITGF